jgi:hypothetical protein
MSGRLFWGVDTFNRADQPVAGTGGKTLYDHVVEKFKPLRPGGKGPDFWGRYIGAANPLTPPEADFLLKKGCRILVIYNRANFGKFKDPHTKAPVGTRSDGEGAAGDAIKIAAGLGMPRGAFIFADIEWWMQPSKDWLVGWCSTMLRSQYGGAGGFYCNTDSPRVSRFSEEFQKVFQGEINPKTGAIIPPPPFLPHFCRLYAQQPNNKGCQVIPAKYEPVKLTWFPHDPCLWQYATKCDIPPGKEQGLYDLDLADELGWQSLWVP